MLNSFIILINIALEYTFCNRKGDRQIIFFKNTDFDMHIVIIIIAKKTVWQ